MDLEKIAHSTELTYLDKVAAIVDAYANGEVDGATADSIAVDAGISPEDLLAVFEANYADGAMEKTAADEALGLLEKVASDENATYLDKAASVAYSFASGALTGEEADEVAETLGLDPADVANVFMAEYGDEAGMEKTAAAEDALSMLEKVATSEEASYLEKAAAVVDAFAAGALSGDEADEIASTIGVAPADLVDIYDFAYGGLEKEAEEKEGFTTKLKKKYEKAKEGIGKGYQATKDVLSGKNVNELKDQLKILNKDTGYAKEVKSKLLKARLKTHGARLAGAGALAGLGYGAYKAATK